LAIKRVKVWGHNDIVVLLARAQLLVSWFVAVCFEGGHLVLCVASEDNLVIVDNLYEAVVVGLVGYGGNYQFAGRMLFKGDLGLCLGSGDGEVLYLILIQ